MKYLLLLLLTLPNNEIFPENLEENLIKQEVTATIYHADPSQTNEDYLTTASGAKINPDHPGKHRYLAVSRDLEEEGFTLGTKVEVKGTGELDGIWYIEDRMNKRHKKKIDFLVNKYRKYGKWNNICIVLLP